MEESLLEYFFVLIETLMSYWDLARSTLTQQVGKTKTIKWYIEDEQGWLVAFFFLVRISTCLDPVRSSQVILRSFINSEYTHFSKVFLSCTFLILLLIVLPLFFYRVSFPNKLTHFILFIYSSLWLYWRTKNSWLSDGSRPTYCLDTSRCFRLSTRYDAGK